MLLRVHAAGVDRGVWHIMAGLPYPIRLAGYGFRAPKTPSPGPRGRRAGRGGRQERHHASSRATRSTASPTAPSPSTPSAGADKLAPKPANLTFEQAAAVPDLRAHRAAGRARRRAGPGRAEGADHRRVRRRRHASPCRSPRRSAPRSPACAAPPRSDLVRSLGADHVIDYTREDFTDGGHRYDVILDIGGNRRCRHLRRALTPTRHARHRRRRDRRPVARRLRPLSCGRPSLSPFVSQTLSTLIASENAAGPRRPHASSSRPARSRRSSTGPTR